MATIHPCPKTVVLRGDGDGGFDLCITTSRQEFEVLPLSRRRAAEMASHLNQWLAEKCKEDEQREASR